MSADRSLEAALAYAECFGLAVFPVRRRGKQPLTQHGCRDATKESLVILRHWGVNPGANVGIATGKASGIVALDIDVRHGGDRALAALEVRYGRLPHAPTALTGGGGRHVYFLYPTGLDRIANSAGTIGSGLDIRADGGYVVAPPSLHENGKEYRWQDSSGIGEVELPPVPGWLLELITKSDVPGDAKRFEAAPTIEAGGRNDALFRLARSLHAQKLNHDEILATLRIFNEGRCMPPLDCAEVERIARNASTEPDRPDFHAPDLEVVKLAALSPVEYDKTRKAEAQRLGIRLKVLDEEVAKARPKDSPNVQHESLAPAAPEAWLEPIEGLSLLNDLKDFLARFVVIAEHALVALALWIVFSYLLDVAETSPRLAILSPVKRCGKTRLIDLLTALAYRPISTSNISPSAVFRAIDAEHPSILIDEADTFTNGDDECAAS